MAENVRVSGAAVQHDSHAGMPGHSTEPPCPGWAGSSRCSPGQALEGAGTSQLSSAGVQDEVSQGKDWKGTPVKVLQDPRIPQVTAHPTTTSSDHKPAKPNLIYFFKVEFPQILL